MLFFKHEDFQFNFLNSKGEFILHFTGVIECIILVDRMKNFSSFIKKFLTISSKKLTLILVGVCLFIDVFACFEFSPYGFVWQYYTKNGQLKTYTDYYVAASPIASTKMGSIVEIIIFCVRDGVSLIFSITLNIISFIQMKRHASKKVSMIITPVAASTSPRPNIDRQRKYQKNMSQMIISLCLITVLVKITNLSSGISWLFTSDLIAVVFGVSADTFIALNSAVPFFIYFRFNRKFRANLFRLVLGRGKKTSLTDVHSTRVE